MKSPKKPAPNTSSRPASAAPRKQAAAKASASTPFARYALIGVLALTFLCFLPSLGNEFTNWDDPEYVTENMVLQKGTLKEVVSSYFVGNYHPITMLTYRMEYALFGLNPKAYHTTNLILHLLNTLLVFLFVQRLFAAATSQQEKAGSLNAWLIPAAVALLFGIHPMHVESVAWVAERKDLLYVGFYLAALYAYVGHATRPSVMRYLVVAVLFVCALLSKGVAVTLPIALLLIDAFVGRSLAAKVWLEKLPLLALSIGFGLLAIKAQQSASALSEVPPYTLVERFAIASYGIVMYVAEAVYPFRLATFHPYPTRIGVPIPSYMWLCLAGVLASASGVVFWALKKRDSQPMLVRTTLFGLAFFLLTLALVLQLLPVGSAIIADRYSYLPYLGLFLPLAWALANAGKSQKIALGVCGVWMAILGIMTWQQCGVWRNSDLLWTQVIEHYPNRAPNAYNNRGNYWGREKNELARAMKDYAQCIAVDPTYPNVYVNRGNVYGMRGQFAESVADFSHALELKHDSAKCIANRGLSYFQMKEWEKSSKDLEIHVKASPEKGSVHEMLALCYFNMGKYPQALTEFSETIRRKHGLPNAYFNRSVTYSRLGDVENARADVEMAKKLGYKVPPTYVPGGK